MGTRAAASPSSRSPRTKATMSHCAYEVLVAPDHRQVQPAGRPMCEERDDQAVAEGHRRIERQAVRVGIGHQPLAQVRQLVRRLQALSLVMDRDGLTTEAGAPAAGPAPNAIGSHPAASIPPPLEPAMMPSKTSCRPKRRAIDPRPRLSHAEDGLTAVFARAPRAA